jgi:hypothetical protein
MSINCERKKYVSGFPTRYLPEECGFGMKFGIVLYSSNITLKSPSIIVRQHLQRRTSRSIFSRDPSGISTLRRAVTVQADVPNPSAERIFVPQGTLRPHCYQEGSLQQRNKSQNLHGRGDRGLPCSC